MQFIDLKTQQDLIRDKIDKRIADVLAHGQYINGPEITELEKQLSGFCGAAHSIGVASGTDALLLALMAAGVGPGDEVITTPFTFIATGEMIALTGAKCVFVDIDEKTFNIDAGKIEEKITSKTKAIIPVSLYGQVADMQTINAIAGQHKLVVIEDAAQSFGAEYKTQKSCNLSTMATTSFFPAKPLGCYGDGGAVFTSDEELANRIKMLRNHGQSERYMHPVIGINGRLDTMQAAILIEKLAIFADEIKKRQQVAKGYDNALSDSFITPHIAEGNLSVYAQYTIRCKDREKVQQAMKNAGVPFAVHYPVPLHLQPAFAEHDGKAGDFPKAEQAAKEVLSLPMHPYLSQEDQQKVITAVLEGA